MKLFDNSETSVNQSGSGQPLMSQSINTGISSFKISHVENLAAIDTAKFKDKKILSMKKL